MARIIYCKKCNKKIAEVTGQISPNAVMLCGNCYSKDDEMINHVIGGNSFVNDLLTNSKFFKNKGI